MSEYETSSESIYIDELEYMRIVALAHARQRDLAVQRQAVQTDPATVFLILRTAFNRLTIRKVGKILFYLLLIYIIFRKYIKACIKMPS